MNKNGNPVNIEEAKKRLKRRKERLQNKKVGDKRENDMKIKVMMDYCADPVGYLGERTTWEGLKEVNL